MLNNVVGLLDAGTPPVTNSYESIATVTVGSGGASVMTFSSIPSTYKHLQIRIFSRESLGTATGGIYAQMNSDTGNNYTWHRLYGDGITANAGGSSTGQPSSLAGITSTTNGSANVFVASIVDILDYTNTSKNKTIRSLTGFDYNGSGYVGLHSGSWMSTSAVTTIDIKPDSGQNWQQYTVASLYGIKG